VVHNHLKSEVESDASADKGPFYAMDTSYVQIDPKPGEQFDPATYTPIDFTRLRDDGIGLHIAKATQGAGEVDEAYAATARAAQTNKILLMPYHFLTSEKSGQGSPEAQAEHFVATVDRSGFSGFVGAAAMLDVEPKKTKIFDSQPTIEDVERFRTEFGLLVPSRQFQLYTYRVLVGARNGQSCPARRGRTSCGGVSAR
jgi:GH25 family lysozyme M1 (1,4-beta-N-acetylmuramidase)